MSSDTTSNLILMGTRKRNATERAIDNPEFEAARRKRSKTTATATTENVPSPAISATQTGQPDENDDGPGIPPVLTQSEKSTLAPGSPDESNSDDDDGIEE
ncbi:hypothetical protein H0H92_000513, partial [Tricholoma furcatifolium]